MLDQTNANIERHIKTHTERSDDDRSAVFSIDTSRQKSLAIIKEKLKQDKNT